MTVVSRRSQERYLNVCVPYYTGAPLWLERDTEADSFASHPSPFKVPSCVILPIAEQWIREFLLRSAFALAPAS
jgi:hypothetical protein